jgi:hypothetical protein
LSNATSSAVPAALRVKTIDTFVYRLGDQVDAWSVALLRTLGGNVAAIALVAMGLAGLWLLNALWLGRRGKRPWRRSPPRRPTVNRRRSRCVDFMKYSA